MTDYFATPHDDQDPGDGDRHVEPFTIADMHRNTLEWLDNNEHDYETLVGGPLGPALDPDELRDLAENPESMARFRSNVCDLLAQEAARCPSD